MLSSLLCPVLILNFCCAVCFFCDFFFMFFCPDLHASADKIILVLFQHFNVNINHTEVAACSKQVECFCENVLGFLQK